MPGSIRDWSTAWLRPPQLGFQIYHMEARGKETAADVTEKKVQKFVDKFLKSVDEVAGPPEEYEGVADEELPDDDAPAQVCLVSEGAGAVRGVG